MGTKKTTLGPTSNVGGVEKFIDTSYDVVKKVSDNIDYVISLEQQISIMGSNYLGAFADEPLVRPSDSSPLKNGDAYFNTTLLQAYAFLDDTWIHQNTFYDQDAFEAAVGAGPFNIWIAYADDALGTGITTTPTAEKKYIGFANSRDTSVVDIGNPANFAWSYIEGPPATDGDKGDDGTPAYMHIAYADNADGSSGFNFTTGRYIGVYTDAIVTDSNDNTFYTWNELGSIGIDGDPGQDGQDGLLDIENPLTPVNVATSVTASSVKITWGVPDYSGHWYTKVYKTTWDGATYVPFEEGFYATAVQGDYIDLSVDSNTNYLYWIRHVNLNNVASGLYGGNGIEVITSVSLADLQDWITEGNMDPALQTRLALIDSELIAPGDGGLYQAMIDMDLTVTGLTATVGTIDSEGNTTAGNLASLTDDHDALALVVGDANAGLYWQVGLNTTSGEANNAAIQLNIASIGGLHAQFTVKINNNGHISGFGLASTTSDYDGGVHSEFAVLADKFVIATPGNTTSVPFLVDGANTYINSLYVEDGSINNLKIGDTIQSNNWNAGTKAGWLMDKNGNIEGNSLTLYDSTGTTIFSSGTSAADLQNSSQQWDDITGKPAGVVQTFYSSVAPLTPPAEDGDYWIDSDDGKTYFLSSSDPDVWTLIQDEEIQDALANAATAQATADGKVLTYAQNSAPGGLNAAENDGDIWMDTDDNNKLYRYAHPSWVPYAQESADWTKVFARPTDNELLNVNTTPADIGFTGALNANYITDTNQLADSALLGLTANWSNINNISGWAGLNGITVANASTYIESAAIKNAQIGTLDAAKINTGSLNAARIAANTIVASHIAADQITAAKMAANSITAGNAAIQNAAITSAKIGNLQVTSAQIANLTVGSDKITAAAISDIKTAFSRADNGVTTTQETLLSITMNVSDVAKVVLMYTGKLSLSINYGIMRYKLYRGTTLLSYVDFYPFQQMGIPFTYTDTSPGTSTSQAYSIQADNQTGGSTLLCGNNSFVAMGLKK